jgi:predicted acyl esterase
VSRPTIVARSLPDPVDLVTQGRSKHRTAPSVRDSGECGRKRCRAALDCREAESETELCSRSGDLDLTRSKIIGTQGSDDMPQDSPPQYRVLVEKDVSMTTRDGLTLRADVYRPTHRGAFLSCCRACRTTRTCGRAPGTSTTLSSAATG